MTEGERWTLEALADLRASRFTPRAWSVFLARSFARARENRRERKREHRQTLGLGAAGLVAWAAVAVAVGPGLALAGAAWWLLVVLMLSWHLGMLERPDGAPVRGLGLANVLTLARAAFVPAVLVLAGDWLAAILIAGGTTDVLDGWVARARDEGTRLGFWLDGAVDGLFLGAAAVALLRAGLLPAWAATLLLARYALPWLVLGATYFALGRAAERERVVSARLPGVVLFAGLVLLALDVTAGTALVAAGALGGLAALGASVARKPLAS
ncbi:MAG: CDP-alcohol phosphatidyltransferase family protein [Actinobacteria bacterium]|nr:CDP-alcohol phosphatidyltransferase family protein [Actinomycetota bacterium]